MPVAFLMARSVTIEQLAVAFTQHKDSIVARQASLSLRDVRWLLADAMGLPRGSLNCAEYKAWVADAVQGALQHAAAAGQDGPSASNRCHAARLPTSVISRVLEFLDDDQDPVNALVMCRAWRNAGDDASLWQTRMCMLCTATGEPRMHDEAARAANVDFRRQYQDAARRVCHDCRLLGMRAPQMYVPRAAPPSGRQSVRLCDDCWAGYRHTMPQQQLITHGTARFRFRLRLKEDLGTLPSAIAPNPVNVGFAPMYLSRLSVVRCAVIRRWGSEEDMMKHMRRPHCKEESSSS